MQFIQMIIRVINRIGIWLDRLRSQPLRWALKDCGRNVVLKRGIKITHPASVSVGDNSYLSEFCWISMLSVNRQNNSPDVALKPTVVIGDNCYIGRFAMFACMDEIRLGNDVMISDRVYIGDCNHGYSNRELPIKDQYMFSPGPVSIGDGSWLGINVAVMPNVSIGKGCVIGANSVVTRDVPDYHIAAGAPARVIKAVDERGGIKPQ